MKPYYYVGLDVHKKTISYCMKRSDGTVVQEGTLRAARRAVMSWAQSMKVPWVGAMEATMFTGWIYDTLLPYAEDLQVGHSFMLRAIVASKKKSDRVDAQLADLLRCDLFPACYMAPQELRDLRRVLRYRNLLVQEAIRMKNKAAGLLMEVGAEYDKQRLHGKRYFGALLDRLDYVPPSVVDLLKLTRSSLEIFDAGQRRLTKALQSHPELRIRVERLMTIPGVGEVTALTWVLEIAEPHRFSSRKKAVSYCGLCSGSATSTCRRCSSRRPSWRPGGTRNSPQCMNRNGAEARTPIGPPWPWPAKLWPICCTWTKRERSFSLVTQLSSTVPAGPRRLGTGRAASGPRCSM